jgi:hypothetical protein
LLRPERAISCSDARVEDIDDLLERLAGQPDLSEDDVALLARQVTAEPGQEPLEQRRRRGAMFAVLAELAQPDGGRDRRR